MTRWNNLSKKQAKKLGLEGFRQLDQMEKKELQKENKKVKSKKNKSPTEYEEQVKLAEYLDMKGYLWCHVPNGGNRDVRTGAKMKRQGVKPGVPDVLIFNLPKIGYETCNGIAIELKRSNGNPSDLMDTQKKWLDSLDVVGWETKVAFGADDAIDWLEGLEW